MHTAVNRHPNLAARFCQQFDEPVQIIPADPVAPWRYVELEPTASMSMSRSSRYVPPNTPRSAISPPAAFRAALIRTAEDRHRIVLTFHHIVVDGWSMPILLQEIFASYRGQWLARPCHIGDLLPGSRSGPAGAHAAWQEVLAGFDTPTLVGPPGRLELGRRGVESFRVPEQTTRALSELARSRHTTINTVLQGAWALLLTLADRPP